MRYTPTTVFGTFPFPWPVPGEGQREAVAEAARRIVAARRAACDSSGKGLTRVYNSMDDGAYTDLAKAHRDLDRAVLACYDWPATMLEEKPKLLAALFERNAQMSKTKKYAPFGTK